MAGGIPKDPAIERWAFMREHVQLYWRPTPRTMAISIVLLGVVPVAMYYGLQYGEVHQYQQSLAP